MHNVAADYSHYDKLVSPGAPLNLAQASLKWYDIAPADQPVDAEVKAMARDYVAREIDLGDDLGFVILHRCGASFYFLLVSSWRGNNELWESVYAKESAAHPGFAHFNLPGPHRGTFCVWELGAVWHEQQAWKRYLRSARDGAARAAYLADQFSGPV